MNSKFFLSLTALALVPCAGAVAQQDEPIMLDTVTVTAARAKRPVEEVPQTIQVIERREIEEQLRMGNSAGALLSRRVPGYSVSNQTISAASETFRGRDLLVMIDGVPMNTPLRDVSRILSLIDLNTVERVELVAGASSLYGSGATGGTVNFITREAAEDTIRLDVSTTLRAFTHNIGSSLAPEVSATLSGRGSGLDYLATATGRFSNKTYDGDGREQPSDAMLGQGGGDRTDEGTLFARLGYAFDAEKRLEASVNLFRLEQEPDWLTTYTAPYARPDFSTPYEGESVKEDTVSFSGRYTDSGFALGALSIAAYYNDVEKRFNFTEFSFPYNSLVYYSGNPLDPTSPYNQSVLHANRGGINLTVDTPLDMIVKGTSLTWGTDFTRDKTWQTLTSGEDIFTPLTQNGYAAFVQLQVPVGERITVRGGIRYEYLDLKVEDFTRPAVFYGLTPTFGYVLPALPVKGGDFNYDALTFNAGATFEITKDAEVYASFNQGFGLPDVGAFTRRAGATIAYACPVTMPACLPAGTFVSYDSIGPEAQIVDNYEIGLRAGGDWYRASLAAFVSTSDQGINFDARNNQVTQQKEITYGIEATAEVDVTDALTLGGIFSFREGEYDRDLDGDTDESLPNNRIATPYRGTLYADYLFEGGTALHVEGEFWSGRDVYDGTAVYPIQAGAVMNASVNQPLLGGDLYVAVNNVFDSDYQNPTATATRNLPVIAWGRTIVLGYARSF